MVTPMLVSVSVQGYSLIKAIVSDTVKLSVMCLLNMPLFHPVSTCKQGWASHLKNVIGYSFI